MIIKVENFRHNKWHLFDDVKQLTFQKLPELNADNEPFDSDIIDYSGTLFQPEDLNAPPRSFPGRVFFEFIQEHEIIKVVAFSPVYLMNEKGKTIEII